MTTRTVRFELNETQMEELRKHARHQVRRPNEQAKMLVLLGLGLATDQQMKLYITNLANGSQAIES